MSPSGVKQAAYGETRTANIKKKLMKNKFNVEAATPANAVQQSSTRTERVAVKHNANRELPTQKVLALLKRELPSQYELAEIVGKWVWLDFPQATHRAAANTLSVACFDSQNRGVLDLLTTGQSAAADGSANFGCQIFLNTNPITAGTAFTTTQPAAINNGIAGALFNSFNAIFNFSNDNYPSWTVGGDNTFCIELLINTGSNFGLSLGLDWLVSGSFYKNFLTPVYNFNVGNQHIAGPGRGVAADFDQDGFDDLVILDQNGGYGLAGVSSYSTYTPSAFLLHNVPNAGQSTAQIGLNITPRLFASVATTLPTPSVNSGNGQTIAVGDVNNDGYPDLFIALQQPDGTYITRIYLNQQGKGFVPGADIVLPGSTTGLVFPSAVLADFNGDGNLDLLLAGWGDDSAPTTVIYYGDGTGHFTNSNLALPQRSYASVAVGDLFNHGRNDIVIGGNYGNTLVLRNDGGSFTAFDWGIFPAVSKSGRNIALADVDNDGKLDIAAGDQEDNGAPQHWNGYPLAVYRNAMNIPTNAPPFAPTNLVSQVGNGTVTLHWGNASDDITPANLLTYNLRSGTNSLGTDTVSPLANPTTGWRKVVAPGNRGHNFQCTYHLPPGTYYWSVQAVDGAFAGGAWATEQTFTITNAGVPLVALATATNIATLSWPGWASAYHLQSTTNLSGGAWVDETNLTTYNTMSGFAADTTNTLSVKFFRLKTP